MEDEQNFCSAKEFVMAVLYLQHPISYDQYDICSMVKDKCSFCKTDLETLHHLLYSCPYSKTFWDEFELYWFSISKERISLSKKDIIVGIITRTCPLLNYLLIISQNSTYGIVEGAKLFQMLKLLILKFK